MNYEDKYNELKAAVKHFIQCENEYLDKAQGYRHGGASISEWSVADSERSKAVLNLFDLTKTYPTND